MAVNNWVAGVFSPLKNRVRTLNTTIRAPPCGWDSGFLMTWKKMLVQGPTEIGGGGSWWSIGGGFKHVRSLCLLRREGKNTFWWISFHWVQNGVKSQEKCFAGGPTPSKRKPKTNQSSYKKHQKHHRPRNLLQPTIGYPKKRQNCKTNLQAKTPSRQLFQTLHVNGYS